jgi:uncharacterized RDD family membrane protein YckC
MTARLATGAEPDASPSLLRRMACFVYEGVLLFGVLMIAGYLYSTLTQQRHALSGRVGLQAFLFVVLGIYFTWFWSHGGQTVAMKAWHIRLVGRDGGPVTESRAFARYLFSWLWFVPALLVLWLSGARDPAPIAAALFAGIVGFAALALLHPARQFLHDAVGGTKLITSRPAPRAAA